MKYLLVGALLLLSACNIDRCVLGHTYIKNTQQEVYKSDGLTLDHLVETPEVIFMCDKFVNVNIEPTK